MILRNGTGIFANEAAEKAGIAKAVLADGPFAFSATPLSPI